MWKARLSELDFNGAEPASVLDAMDSGWITAGPRTEEFEKEFSRRCGTSEAVAVSNGSAALFLALKALGIGPGDEVLCPSLTFVATAAAVVHCGATPVLVDICSLLDPTMDPADAERKVTSRTKALLPVHYAGIPANMRALRKLANDRGLLIIEDAAHAPGARYDGRACGNLGDAGCFSFFGNKNISTAEGGMITTSSASLTDRLRMLRSNGMTVNSWDRDKGRPGYYDVLEFGFNFRFDDIRAALGLTQLSKLDRINNRRKELAERYNKHFADSGMNLILPFGKVPAIKEPSYHLYPVIFPTGEERNTMEALLREEGIQTSIHYRPIHHFQAFTSTFPRVSLPITEEFASRELTLPLYSSMTDEHVDIVATAVQQCRMRTASISQV